MTKLGMVVFCLFVLSHKFIICLHLFSSGSWKIIGIIDLVRKTVIYKYLWLPSLQNEWLALPNLRAHAQVSLLRKYLYITRCLIGSIWPSLPNRTLWSARPIHMDMPANCENVQRGSEQEKCRTTAEEPKMASLTLKRVTTEVPPRF